MHLELNENERKWKKTLSRLWLQILKNNNNNNNNNNSNNKIYIHYFVGSKGGKKETKDLLTEPRVAPGCTNRASSLTTFAHQAAAALAWWQAAAYLCLFALKVCLFACLLADSSSARGTCNLALGVGAENQYWCQEAQKRSCGEEEWSSCRFAMSLHSNLQSCKNVFFFTRKN